MRNEFTLSAATRTDWLTAVRDRGRRRVASGARMEHGGMEGETITRRKVRTRERRRVMTRARYRWLSRAIDAQARRRAQPPDRHFPRPLVLPPLLLDSAYAERAKEETTSSSWWIAPDRQDRMRVHPSICPSVSVDRKLGQKQASSTIARDPPRGAMPLQDSESCRVNRRWMEKFFIKPLSPGRVLSLVALLSFGYIVASTLWLVEICVSCYLQFSSVSAWNMIFSLLILSDNVFPETRLYSHLYRLQFFEICVDGSRLCCVRHNRSDNCFVNAWFFRFNMSASLDCGTSSYFIKPLVASRRSVLPKLVTFNPGYLNRCWITCPSIRPSCIFLVLSHLVLSLRRSYRFSLISKMH
jgi:hypothetical protein